MTSLKDVPCIHLELSRAADRLRTRPCVVSGQGGCRNGTSRHEFRRIAVRELAERRRKPTQYFDGSRVRFYYMYYDFERMTGNYFVQFCTVLMEFENSDVPLVLGWIFAMQGVAGEEQRWLSVDEGRGARLPRP